MPLLLTTKLSKNKTPQSQRYANFAVTTYGLKQNRIAFDAASNHSASIEAGVTASAVRHWMSYVTEKRPVD